MKQSKTDRKSIDFSALDIKKNFSATSLTPGMVIAITLFSLVLMGILAMVSVDLMTGAVVVIGLGLVVIFYSLQSRYHKQKAAALNTFASKNAFSYGEIGVGIWGPGSLFTHGHSKFMTNVIGGTFHGLPFSFYEYTYDEGSGKTQRTYDVTVMEFTLPRQLPHMVIDSLVEPGNYSLSTLPIQFKASQRIDLEGDFYKYFALYAPDTYGVTALSIIAPDVMEVLMRHASLCDIEIVGNRLYFYWPDVEVSSQKFKAKFNTAQAVLDEIGRKLTKGDVFGKPSQARIHSSPGKSVRLKEFSWKPVIAIAVVLYFAQGFASFFFPRLPDVFGWFVLVGLIWLAWKLYQRKQLQQSLARRFGDISTTK